MKSLRSKLKNEKTGWIRLLLILFFLSLILFFELKLREKLTYFSFFTLGAAVSLVSLSKSRYINWFMALAILLGNTLFILISGRTGSFVEFFLYPVFLIAIVLLLRYLISLYHNEHPVFYSLNRTALVVLIVIGISGILLYPYNILTVFETDLSFPEKYQPAFVYAMGNSLSVFLVYIIILVIAHKSIKLFPVTALRTVSLLSGVSIIIVVSLLTVTTKLFLEKPVLLFCYAAVYLLFAFKNRLNLSLFILGITGIIICLQPVFGNNNSMTDSMELLRDFYLLLLLVFPSLYLTTIAIDDVKNRYDQILKEKEKIQTDLSLQAAKHHSLINELEKLENELNYSEERYQKFSKITSEAILIHDNGIAIDVNEAFLKLSGYTRDEVIGKNLVPLILNDKDKEKVFIDILENKERCHEFLVRTKRNTEVLVEVCTKNIKFRNDNLRVVTVKNISESKRTEQELEILKTAVQQSPNGIIITDKEGNIEFANPSFTKITGYTFDEIMGKNPRILKSGHHTEDFYKTIWNTITEGEIWTGEFLNRKKDGTLYWENAAIGPIKGSDNNISHYIGIKEDITEKKRISESLKFSESLFRNLAENAPVFIAMINKKGYIQYSNSKVEDLIRIINKSESFFDLVSGEYGQMLREKLNRVFLENKTETFELKGFAENPEATYYTIISPNSSVHQVESAILIAQDISSVIEVRKIAEDSKRQYQLLADNVIDIIWVLDNQLKYSYVSPSIYQLLGFKPDEILGKKAGHILPDLPDAVVKMYEESGFALNKNQFISGNKWESLSKTSRNQEIWLESVVKPFFNQQNEVEGIIGISRDISERKDSEIDLRESEELFRNFIEYSQANILSCDPETLKITESNKAAQKFYGYSNEEFKTLTLFDLTNEPETYTRQILDKKTGHNKSFIIKHKLKDGNIKDIELYPSYISTSSGQYLFLIMQDITRRRQAIKALTDSEAKKMALLKIIPDLIFVFNRKGDFIDIYAEDTSRLSLLPQEIIGRNLKDVFPRKMAKKVLAYISLALDSGDVQSFNYRSELKPDNPKFEEIRIIRSGYEEVLVIMRDITVQMSTEMELKQAWQEAKEANRVKGVFLANISHEIRTPINAIIGFSELLDKELNNPVHKAYINSVKSGSKTLMRLIDDLLDLSKIESGKIELRKDAVNIRNLIDDVYKLFSLRIKEKDLDCIIEIKPAVPEILILDEVRLRQIFFNIIGNAIKFTEEGYIRLEVSAQKNEREHTIIIKISDTGIGISPDSQERIFDAFTQQDDQDSRKYGGTGLGLTITKKLIELMDGSINLKSIPGKGTTFHITFTNVKSESRIKSSKSKSPEPVQEEKIFNNETVLVADDVDINRELLVNFLQKINIKPLEASDGKEALEMIYKHKPDVALLDIRMPMMDGIELARIIRKDEDFKNLKIIGVSATPVSRKIVRELLDDFLQKPVRYKQLTNVLVKVLEKRIDTKKPKTEKPQIFNVSPKLMDDFRINALPKIETEYNKVKQSPSFNEIMLFANELNTIADNYKLKPLKKYASELTNSANSFDLEDIFILLEKCDNEIALYKN